MPRISLRKRVKWALAHKKLPRTAAQIQAIPSVGSYAGLGTLSSLLKKMVDDEELVVVDNFGPRGGNGYRLKRADD
jgi:hypothetical protein